MGNLAMDLRKIAIELRPEVEEELEKQKSIMTRAAQENKFSILLSPGLNFEQTVIRLLKDEGIEVIHHKEVSRPWFELKW